MCSGRTIFLMFVGSLNKALGTKLLRPVYFKAYFVAVTKSFSRNCLSHYYVYMDVYTYIPLYGT